ncbi:MAG TPA: glycerophosphodiester phosphodiesterase family protein [Kofleriaceae bacterium]
MTANPFLARKPRPLVVGHRGVPRLHQENTLAGFRRAVALGIPAIELDVRLTRDGQAVVFHDPDLHRLTGTPRNVSDLTWDELSKLRLRTSVRMGLDAHGNAVVQHYERAEPIPLFAEVLAEVARDVVINVELKLDVQRWWPIEVGAVAARIIQEAGVEDRVIVTSFDLRKLREAKRVHPGLATGFCFDDTMLNFASGILDRLPPVKARLGFHDGHPNHHARALLNRILDSHVVARFLDARLVGADHTLVGDDTVAMLHKRGVAIGTHTLFPIGSSTGKPLAASASTEREVARLVELGVDWIESDDPERLLAVMERVSR